jgi:hypothetical protein
VNQNTRQGVGHDNECTTCVCHAAATVNRPGSTHHHIHRYSIRAILCRVAAMVNRRGLPRQRHPRKAVSRINAHRASGAGTPRVRPRIQHSIRSNLCRGAARVSRRGSPRQRHPRKAVSRINAHRASGAGTPRVRPRIQHSIRSNLCRVAAMVNRRRSPRPQRESGTPGKQSTGSTRTAPAVQVLPAPRRGALRKEPTRPWASLRDSPRLFNSTATR